MPASRKTALKSAQYEKNVGLNLYFLNYSTAGYDLLFTAQPLKNACDISPLTNYGYCLGDFDGETYIARFGPDAKVRWVAKLPCQSFSGTFGSIQNTFYFGCDRNLYPSPMWIV